MVDAAQVLEFFQGEGARWEIYLHGPRPLMMGFESPSDKKWSYYWLFVPKNYDPKKQDYPFYFELHGSGGGSNNNPRKMLYQPLQPKIAGVPNQGYRKEGWYVLPWGRGDRGYRDQQKPDRLFNPLSSGYPAIGRDGRLSLAARTKDGHQWL